MSFFTKLFGGSRSKQSSESGNKAYPGLQQQLGGSVGYVPQSGNAIAAMLGLGGDAAGQNAAFDRFKDSTGYQFQLDSGREAISGGNASRGLFNSGATGKALMGYGQKLAQSTYGDYMDRLLGLGKMGLGSAGVLSDAGKYNQSQGSSSNDTGGLGKFIGSIFASEPYLKQNIEKLGELEDGLGIYAYEYKSEPGVLQIGTMVNEVANLRPWALGPTTDEGHRTVNYAELGKGK